MNEILKESLWVLLYFGIGILIGIIIFFIILLILRIIKNKKPKKENIDIILNREELLNNIIKNYELNLKILPFKKKIKELKPFLFDIVKTVASSYHPASKMPLLEVSIDKLLNTTSEINNKIEELVYAIINNKLFIILFKTYVTFDKIKSFFKRKSALSYDINKLTINQIIDIIEKILSMDNKKDKSIIDNISKLNNYIDNLINDLIIYIFNLSIRTYSDNYEVMISD